MSSTADHQPGQPALAPAFRLADQTDSDTLVELMRQFNAIDAYPFDAQITQATLAHFIADPTLGRLWLILAGEDAVGYLAIASGYSFEYHGRDAFIDELYLLPSHRGQGIGTRAIQFALTPALAWKCMPCIWKWSSTTPLPSGSIGGPDLKNITAFC